MNKSFIKKNLFGLLVVLLVSGYGVDAFSFGSSPPKRPPPPEYLTCAPFATAPAPYGSDDSYVISGQFYGASEIIFDEFCYRVTAVIGGAFETLENMKDEINELEAKQDDVCEITKEDLCNPTIAEIRDVLECPLVLPFCGANDATISAVDPKIKAIREMQ